jgi:hypothetical protein
VQTSGNHVREGVEWSRPAMVLVEFSCAGPNDGADTIRRLCSVPKKKKYYTKKRFSVLSNLRYMHGVLNVDKIKN